MRDPHTYTEKEREYLDWLQREGGYVVPRMIDGDDWCAVFEFAFTSAVIRGRIHDYAGYSDRWCYHTTEDAIVAMFEWGGVGEPAGWHRHPPSGRRRTYDGPNVLEEWVNL